MHLLRIQPASYIAPVSPIENVAPVEVPAYNQLQQTEAPHTEVPQAEIQSKENILSSFP